MSDTTELKEIARDLMRLESRDDFNLEVFVKTVSEMSGLDEVEVRAWLKDAKETYYPELVLEDA